MQQADAPKGAGSRRCGGAGGKLPGMDVEMVEAELRALRPAEFTAARDGYAAQARKGGNKPLAARIAALRKPTLAAWTAGLLVRSRPKEAQGLVDLGEALRAAHRTLDAGLLRKLSHDQHLVIGELARTARALAAEAGQPVSEPVLREVEQILHAVLADAEVAALWRAGRLVRAPEAAQGFTGLEPLPGAAPPGPAQDRPAADDAPPETPAERTRRERAAAAEAQAAEAFAEAERLGADQTAAREAAESAAATLARAEEELRAATDRLEAAREASMDAHASQREAERAAARARRQAQAAARKAVKLTG